VSQPCGTPQPVSGRAAGSFRDIMHHRRFCRRRTEATRLGTVTEQLGSRGNLHCSDVKNRFVGDVMENNADSKQDGALCVGG
jgi:hypothetical protein